MVTIKDIYAGKPDAKDEIETEGLDSFLANYVIPANFDTESLLYGTNCFISGYKGTGKTAVLYYLDNASRDIDEQTYSSFIFFKGDYSDLKKQEMQQLAKRITSAISIGSDVVLDGTDFEIIWRWLLYTRIIDDNQSYNYGIYIKDKVWDDFEKTIGRICYEKKKHFLQIPASISFAVKDSTQQNTLVPTCDINFKNAKVEDTDNYRLFVRLIEKADELFKLLKRTDIPYYIYIDELEAYYGDETVFKRDLRLIRDLLFTVKKMNLVMRGNKEVVTKIICSVRTEIINAINRFIVSKELNKVTSGFDVPLIWDYTNTNSFNHPIMQILIKRIEYGERQLGEYVNEKQLIEKWFPEKLGNMDAANYLLNNSWCKPRDIVRLIQAAQNNLASANCNFSQQTIDLSRKRYSAESLMEIEEELKALYRPEDINSIIQCLTGFKRIFSFSEISERVNKFHANTVWSSKLHDVLNDLYRLGIIGNYIQMSKSYRWQHKGDNGIIIDDNWMMMIHPALLSALSVNTRQDNAIEKNNEGTVFAPNEEVTFLAVEIYKYFVLGKIFKNNIDYNASVHISEITDGFCESIGDYVVMGGRYTARVIEFNQNRKKWEVSLKSSS